MDSRLLLCWQNNLFGVLLCCSCNRTGVTKRDAGGPVIPDASEPTRTAAMWLQGAAMHAHEDGHRDGHMVCTVCTAVCTAVCVIVCRMRRSGARHYP